jgi:hypothetical protein
MKKYILFYLLLIAMVSNTAKAQNNSNSYTTGLGLKMWGYGAGITLKHFMPNGHALEGIGYAWNGGGRITGLYEFHQPIQGAPGLQWYAGPGLHIGFYNDRNNDRYYYSNWDSGTYVGIDGVLGLDYKFNGIPLNLSLDWQPSFEFGDNRGFIGAWGGLAIRYTFK